MDKKRVIIVGGGFAGIQLVRKLDSKLFDILLIDKLNHHQFQPLFYQVATSQIEPSSISFPFRYVLKHKKNVQIRMTEATGIDTKNNRITTTIGAFDYDYLVLAMGCKTNFFGNTEINKYAFTLKTTYDAITIRNHALNLFEKAVSAAQAEREMLLNLVIVGAGPTGVELAGAFAEIKKYVLPSDYPGIDFSEFRIILIEGSKNALNNMSDSSKKATANYLKKLGIEVITNTFVTGYNGETLTLSTNDTIKSATVIWAAGVTANIISGLNNECLTVGNRILVDRFNKVAGYENVFALGDNSFMTTARYPKGHPQVANVAINQAVNLAKNMKSILQNKRLKEFEYTDLGSMATIGNNMAVVDLPFIRFKG
ncbi:MAG TPA: FAD-dependent oxidoreductase, partial [Bacteroidales bacterium]|nr:FAD-dependent oxidoreductase [Bacteroidales bacterium]